MVVVESKDKVVGKNRRLFRSHALRHMQCRTDIVEQITLAEQTIPPSLCSRRHNIGLVYEAYTIKNQHDFIYGHALEWSITLSSSQE